MAALEPLPEVRRIHSELVGTVFSSDDAKEGAIAFAERRSPAWKGR
jgi:enoyl-CoA hydratase